MKSCFRSYKIKILRILLFLLSIRCKSVRGSFIKVYSGTVGSRLSQMSSLFWTYGTVRNLAIVYPHFVVVVVFTELTEWLRVSVPPANQELCSFSFLFPFPVNEPLGCRPESPRSAPEPFEHRFAIGWYHFPQLAV